MNDRFARSNIFFKMSQRSSEYESGQYVSIIDQVELAQEQNQELKIIRKEVVDCYRGTAPQLFDSLNAEIRGLSDGVQNCVYELGRTNASLKQIQYSIEYGFESIIARLDRGFALLTDIRYILSRTIATQANEFLIRAMDLFADGFYREAHEDFEKVVELDQANFVAWYMIAVIRLEQFGDVGTAQEAFSRCDRYASKRGPQYFSKSLYQQALISASNSELRAAQSMAEKSFSTDDSNFQACFLVAELAAENGDLDLAKKCLEICEEIDSIFYLKSATSTPLVNSGIHEKVFDAATEELTRFNNETLSLLQKQRGDYEIITAFSEYSGTRYSGKVLIDENTRLNSDLITNTPSLPKKKDYLLMRSLHDVLAKETDQLHQNLERAMSFLADTSSYASQDRLRNEERNFEQRGGYIFGVTIVLAIIVLLYNLSNMFGQPNANRIMITFFGSIFKAVGTLIVVPLVLFPLSKLFQIINSKAEESEFKSQSEIFENSRDRLLSIKKRDMYA